MTTKHNPLRLVYRLTWCASEKCPGEYNDQPYATFETREEAFLWGAVLMRIGDKDVKVGSAKGRLPRRTDELFYYLACVYEKKMNLFTDGMHIDYESYAHALARLVGVSIRTNPTRIQAQEQ